MDKKTALDFIKFILSIYFSVMLGWLIFEFGHIFFGCIHHTRFDDWWECKMGHIFSVTLLPMIFGGIIMYLFSKSK